MGAGFTHWVADALAPGSRAEVVERSGHFLQIERPDEVARLIAEFVAD